MQRAYCLQASPCLRNHWTSREGAAPIPSDTACPSVLTSHTPCARPYGNQRVKGISVRDRCLKTHAMSASHPADPGQSSLDYFVWSLCTLRAADPTAKRQLTPNQPQTSERQVPASPTTNHAHTCVATFPPLMSRCFQAAGQCLKKTPIQQNTPHAPHATAPTAITVQPHLPLG